MRRVILGAAIAAMLAGAQPVLSQSNPFRPVVYVNDSVVTEFDIQQRSRFLQLLRAPETDRAAAEKALIEDRLRMQAAKAMDIRPTEEAISAAVAEFAGRGGLSPEQFDKLLGQNGIDPHIFVDFITAGVAWRDVIRARIVPNVHVSDDEVKREYQKIAETPRITDVLLSELIIPAPPGREAEAQALAERIVANTANEGDFAAAARQYSATQSRENGGRLPWTSLDNLPPSLRPILLSMQPGTVSQPLNVEGAVVLFMLRDTRGVVRSGTRDQILEYLQLRLNNPTEATRIATTLRDCSDLFIAARGLPQENLVHETAHQGQIPTGVGLTLSQLDDNEATVVGGDIVMLCKRSSALVAEAETQPQVPVTEGQPPAGKEAGADAPRDPNALPELDQVRDVVFNRKISAAADAYLADLRADAIIRR